MSALLEVTDLHVRRGGREIISGACFKADRGELCALIGLNGSGKTTLMNAVCGFLKMSGRVCVDGTDITFAGERKRAGYVSYIPQIISRQDGRRVMDAVILGMNARLGMFEYPTRDDMTEAGRILEDLGLGDKKDCDFGTLSCGEKQLVILARCIMQNAPVMIMDEPDSSLDFVNRHRMLEMIRTLVRRNGYAGIVSVHDPDYALEYCDRLLILKDGIISCSISVGEASAEEMRAALSSVYGRVDVIHHKGVFHMIEAADL